MAGYKRQIKVVGVDLMCFPVDAETLNPVGVSCYDPWAHSDPEPGVEIMDINTWQLKVNERREREINERLHNQSRRGQVPL